MKLSFLLFSLLLLGGEKFVKAGQQQQSPYLKEILLGRCYFVPPTQDRDDCQSVVGSVMNALESHLDRDIDTSTFAPYLDEADFSSPPNRALLVARFLGGSSSTSFTPPPGLVTPEDTPGGALFQDLVFCGVDQRENCSIEQSNAYWKFWEAGKWLQQQQKWHGRSIHERLRTSRNHKPHLTHSTLLPFFLFSLRRICVPRSRSCTNCVGTFGGLPVLATQCHCQTPSRPGFFRHSVRKSFFARNHLPGECVERHWYRGICLQGRHDGFLPGQSVCRFGPRRSYP